MKPKSVLTEKERLELTNILTESGFDLVYDKSIDDFKDSELISIFQRWFSVDTVNYFEKKSGTDIYDIGDKHFVYFAVDGDSCYVGYGKYPHSSIDFVNSILMSDYKLVSYLNGNKALQMSIVNQFCDVYGCYNNGFVCRYTDDIMKFVDGLIPFNTRNGLDSFMNDIYLNTEGIDKFYEDVTVKKVIVKSRMGMIGEIFKTTNLDKFNALFYPIGSKHSFMVSMDDVTVVGYA